MSRAERWESEEECIKRICDLLSSKERQAFIDGTLTDEEVYELAEGRTIPKEVVELVEKAGYTHGVVYIREWKDYTVFAPDYSYCEGETFGLPNFILVKDDVIRWNTDDEQEEIMYLENNEN